MPLRINSNIFRDNFIRLRRSNCFRRQPCLNKVISVPCSAYHMDGYGDLYYKTQTIRPNFSSYQLKIHESDVCNDLFCQLDMGIASDFINKGFSHNNFKYFPVPMKTPKDKYDIHYVKKYLRHNPDFKYKLRVSFHCRMLTSMLDIWYGKHIQYFNQLAEDAFWSLMNNNTNWNGLYLHVLNSLKGTSFLPKDMTPVDKLCRHTSRKIYHNNKMKPDFLASVIYEYLTHYQPANPRCIDGEMLDSMKLHQYGDPHSVYLIHIAWAFQSKYDDKYKPRSRDFLGYSQLLANFLHFNADFKHRMGLVNLMRHTYHHFLDVNKTHYRKHNYTEFMSALDSRVLTSFPEVDDVLGCGVKFSNAIRDIDEMFFKPARERRLDY